MDRQECVEIFAPDATVIIRDEPVTGTDAIVDLYNTVLAMLQESKHLWNTVRVDDTLLEADWAAALRRRDGSLATMSGFERIRLNADGLIAHLQNFPSRPAS